MDGEQQASTTAAADATPASLLTAVGDVPAATAPPQGTGSAAAVPPPAAVPPAGDSTGQPAQEKQEKAEAQDKAPETYEFSMPDGMAIDQAMADAVSPVMRDLGLKQDQADKLVQAYAAIQAARAREAQETEAAILAGWDKEVKAWPKADDRLRAINRVIARFGDDQVKTLFTAPAYGSNPVLLRFLDKVASIIREDTIETPGATPAATKTAAELLFPSMTQK